MNQKQRLDDKDANSFIASVSRRKRWAVNPDAAFVEILSRGLAANRSRFGYYQCPCRVSWDGDREKDKDIICPCAYSDADVREHGHCFCGLFLSDDYLRSGRHVAQIPERRPDERFP